MSKQPDFPAQSAPGAAGSAGVKRLSVPQLRARKGGEPVVMLTAYSARMAQLADPHCDVLLVGDSVGMVVHGLPSTLEVSYEMMALHGAAVVRGSKRAAVIVDLPFGSFEASPEQAFDTAARLLKATGATGVKLEGGVELAPTTAFLVRRGIPVVAHVGLRPQAVNTLGGYGVRGRDEGEAAQILADARAHDEAGAFAMVVEGVMEPLAVEITAAVSCLTIGIGASAACDGQVLVCDDMLGLFERVPRFVKKYANLADEIAGAIEAYAGEVRARTFPGEGQTYQPKPQN
jgi:3-methyl-2-oxobutanoate hydroxymethyltransferase